MSRPTLTFGSIKVRVEVRESLLEDPEDVVGWIEETILFEYPSVTDDDLRAIERRVEQGGGEVRLTRTASTVVDTALPTL